MDGSRTSAPAGGIVGAGAAASGRGADTVLIVRFLSRDSKDGIVSYQLINNTSMNLNNTNFSRSVAKI